MSAAALFVVIDNQADRKKKLTKNLKKRKDEEKQVKSPKAPTYSEAPEIMNSEEEKEDSPQTTPDFVQNGEEKENEESVNLQKTPELLLNEADNQGV